MKVLLTTSAAPAGSIYWSLTVGRIYEVLGIECDSFRLLDDQNEPVLFAPECFEIMDASEPSFWISQFGEEGERYAYPQAWGVPGYFEDWHDGVKTVREVFAEQLAAWYPVTAQERRK